MALTDRDKRTLTIGGVVVGVLLAGVLLMNLLGGGGGETTSLRTTRSSSTPGGGVGGTTETPSLTPSPALFLAARDHVSIPPGFGSIGGSTSTGTPPTSAPTGTSPTGTGSSTTPGTSSGTRTATAGTASTTIGGHEVVLLDTSSTGVEQASVEVDSTVYHPSAGDSFGPNHQYMLQSVSSNCATFLFGDEAFTLCVPQNK
jgi:hypothetical protein